MRKEVGTPLDYTDPNNWMYLDQNPQEKVDLIYFYPTVVMTNNGKTTADINDELKKNAHSAFSTTGSVFGDYTNVYAPYYRQIPFDIAKKTADVKAFRKLLYTTEVRTDVYAALDIYFATYNKNRPFILAGHSQGSAVIQMILEDYMKSHPEYLKRMVAAYVVGFPITQQWLDENPHIKFATGAEDSSVIISWNTEGASATGKNFVLEKGAIAINPINWKRDTTPASMSENKGSLDLKSMKIVSGVADATLDLNRGVVVCTTRTDYVPAGFTAFFGDKSFHMNEYPFYYQNIMENGQRRINTYFKNNP